MFGAPDSISHPFSLAFLFLSVALFLLGRILRRRDVSEPNTAGCRKLGLDRPSNLRDEDEPKYSIPSDDSHKEGSQYKIKALFIHPIKSCAPIEVSSAELASTGLAWDRQFCFAEHVVPTMFPTGASQVDKQIPQWTFRTLRKPGYEQLVHVRPEVWVPDPDLVRKEGIKNPNLNGALKINYPNIPQGSFPQRLLHQILQTLSLIPNTSSFSVPLLPPKDHTYPLETLSIWKDLPLALNYGIHIPPSLKTYLSIPPANQFSLFRVSPHSYRKIHLPPPNPTAESKESNHVTAFADAYPIQILNLASVRDIASRVHADIPFFTARRFRSNVVVEGAPTYVEDTWKQFRITRSHHPEENENENDDSKPKNSHPPLRFLSATHTLRCRLPNVDPDTGIRHATEPDRTLRATRCIMPEVKKAAMGLQVVCDEGDLGVGKRINVGDGVDVLRWGERGEIWKP